MKIQTIKDINISIDEGKLLLMALSTLTDNGKYGNNGDRHPDDVLDDLIERSLISFGDIPFGKIEETLKNRKRIKKINKLKNGK